MEDTAQPVAPAAETDPIADAMQAFKVHLGQAEKELPPRAENGQFTKPAPEAAAGEEIEAEPSGEAESQVAEQDTDEAAEEAQPEDVALPTSWPSDKAEMWETLPPEAQAFIAQRDGERDAAVNAKFQEAANVKKANEALITEANANRDKYLAATEDVLALVRLDEPFPEQFGAGTGQYDKEGYDLAHSRWKQASQIVSEVQAQREEARAQRIQAMEADEQAAFEEVEARYRPQLLKLIPDIADPAKQGQVISEIARYAIENGVPEQVFIDPAMAKRITSPELTMAWKAMQYDKLQAAKGRVIPKAVKAPTPSMKAGAQPTKSSIQHQALQKAKDRLAKDGSIEAGAAVWKNFL